MSLLTHLQATGVVLIILGLSHAGFSRYFGWDRELSSVSLLTRRVFHVHTFFIGLTLVLAGAGSVLLADELLKPSPLSRAVMGASAVFWTCRWIFQFCVFERAIWRGNQLYTFMHIVFACLWTYLVAVYSWAFAHVW